MEMLVVDILRALGYIDRSRELLDILLGGLQRLKHICQLIHGLHKLGLAERPLGCRAVEPPGAAAQYLKLGSEQVAGMGDRSGCCHRVSRSRPMRAEPSWREQASCLSTDWHSCASGRLLVAQVRSLIVAHIARKTIERFRAALAGHAQAVRGLPTGAGWCNLDYSPIVGEDGAPLGVLVILTEGVAPNRQAESSSRLREVADLVPDLLWSSDPAGNADWCNQRWAEYTGQGFAQASGAGWRDAIHPDDRTQLVRSFQHALESRQPLRQEQRIRRVDGVYRWFLVQAQPLLGQDGQVLRWCGVATDIHEQRAALDAAQATRSEAEMVRWALVDANAALERRIAERTGELVRVNSALEALIRVAPLAIITIDPELHIQRWNPAATQLFGWGEQETVGRRLPDVPIDGLFASPAELSAILQSGVPREMEAASAHKRGAPLSLSVWAAPLYDTFGQVSAVMALLSDITARKQAEAERRALLQRIITAQEDERRRIARELHDSLGQFLSALNLRLSILQHLEGIPASAVADVRHLRAIIGQIDDELERLILELRPPSLDDLGLAEALRRYTEEWTRTTGIPVEIYIAALEIERLQPLVEVTTYRIIQEALTNVFRHARASQVGVVIEQRRDELRVVIEDDGEGFVQTRPVDPPTGRRHLGLLGMAERAALLGGTVTIESTLGRGSAVYLRIPLLP
ncbi:PAS domain S-box protein [Chloroflexia bacterium SDU3-3]|nr:PAS domain S-box protein [Chloroflexia bacterium SDU3-3]